MDGDSDDDRAAASTSAAAGFGVPEEDPDVDLALDLDEHLEKEHGKDRRVWLVKVPKFLLERWQNVKSNNEELGRLRVYNKPLPNGQERIVLLLPPTKQGETPIPVEYSMTIQNKATQNTYIFAERDDVTIGEAGWEPGKGRIKRGADGDGTEVPEKRRKPTLTGVVHHECNLTPRADSESYRSILRQRQAKAVEPKRKLQMLTSDDQELKRLGINGMSSANKKFDSFFKPKDNKKAEAAQKMVRIPRNELLDLLFAAFEQYEYWTVKSLRSHTQQPEGYLKVVLADIAQLNKRGPYAGHWSLSEQYKKKKENDGSETSTPKAEGSGTTGLQGQENGQVKREEGAEDDAEEDVKPDISDDEMEMEQVR